MKVLFTNKYEKQFDRISDQKSRKQIVSTVRSIIDSYGLEDIPSIKKLKGYKNAYRVRSGQYRLGLIYQHDGTVVIAAIDFRKDFYKGFP
ncbi:MAG: type II toxin-antitoxin system RelE family toxin [Cytophagales bacterium]